MPNSLIIGRVRLIRIERVVRILGIVDFELGFVVAFLEQFGYVCVRLDFYAVLVGQPVSYLCGLAERHEDAE